MIPSLKNIYFSVCTRQNKIPSSLKLLEGYVERNEGLHLSICYDAKSIYEGHLSNLQKLPVNPNDIIVLCHDDLEILSDIDTFKKYLSLCLLPNTGFVGVAGSTRFDKEIKGMWWAARSSGETRGFVFQGESIETLNPNYFGPAGQVVALDGCFLAIQYKKLMDIGLSKPDYLTSGWDIYDLHLTIKSHYLGYNNYAVPVLTKHESPGVMREGWFESIKQFLDHHYYNKVLPIKLNYANTNRLPKYV